ncbi:MAG: hypothetical protein COB46_04320 [Rhodospirillaceae bacterium]|nr:MAG: hypothetical protein COB46_04320 [Rhodospirillaceae bacterium]
MNAYKLCFVTLSVSDLRAAEQFYVNILGFKVSRRYAPTNWISLDIDESGGGLGLVEISNDEDRPSSARVDIFVRGLDQLWTTIESKVTIVSPPCHTPWGSYKAVIQDPFANTLGLVEAPQGANLS